MHLITNGAAAFFVVMDVWRRVRFAPSGNPQWPIRAFRSPKNA
jgi:hypothetical protein